MKRKINFAYALIMAAAAGFATFAAIREQGKKEKKDA